MSITAELRNDHSELVRYIGQLRQIISQSSAPNSIELFYFRHGFTKTVLAHLTTEDWVLYPAMLRSTDFEVVATARRFMDEMGGLREAYKIWLARWPTNSIASQWPAFVIETSSLLDAMSNRIHRENYELYPLIEGDVAQAA